MGDRHGPGLGLAVVLRFRMAVGMDLHCIETDPLEDSSLRRPGRAWSTNCMGCMDLPWLKGEVGVVGEGNGLYVRLSDD